MDERERVANLWISQRAEPSGALQRMLLEPTTDDQYQECVDEPRDHEIGSHSPVHGRLDRPHRLAYVLGEIMDLSAPEALDLDPAAFRKRLQRAREAVEAFTRAHCGVVSEAANCQCNRRVPIAVRLGRIRPDEPAFARDGASFADARAFIQRIEDTQRVLELHRTALPVRSASGVAELVIAAIDAVSPTHAHDPDLAERPH